MGFWGCLFGQNQDLLNDNASRLVNAARINAVAMLTPVQDRFPFLREVNSEKWIFVLTIAGVFIAATRLNNLRIGRTREEKVMAIVAKDLSVWDSDGIRGFEDCKGLYETEYELLQKAGHVPDYLGSDAVGKWIVLNVLGKSPQTKEEAMLVRITGSMVINNFFDWWKT